MKREKKLTKRERKAQKGPATLHSNDGEHIHCIACGRHIDASEFDDPATAIVVTCQHKSNFPACVGCRTPAQALLAEHDRTNQPVKTAAAWH
jgi:hypothetical protein